MSWQDYITTQLLGKNLKEGAIAGIDGQIWAKARPPEQRNTSHLCHAVNRSIKGEIYSLKRFQSPGLNVTMEEIKVLLDNYDSQHNLASTSFHLGGQKYFYLR